MEKLFQPKADSPQAKDYSKFVLKPKEEIIAQLKEANKIFLIGCNKCFKEFKKEIITASEENECVELIKMIREEGKKFLGCLDIDFLCNRIITEKIILKEEKLKDADCVLVNSCGLGVQTVAELVEGVVAPVPVFTAADSVPQGGQHSLALDEEKCAACGQCFLGLTAGICPIVNCAKELVNGPCGGAKNGKCEVAIATGLDKDCAWDKIYQRLTLYGLLGDAVDTSKIRDYIKPSLKTKDALTVSVRERRFEGFYGGVYPLEKKEFTNHKPIRVAPEPKQVVIPLLQHSGCPAEPLVKPGDKVFVGQKIGQAKGLISANIHSSISGKVVAVEPRAHPVCADKILSVVIENDGENQFAPEIKPKGELKDLSPKKIKEIIYEAGIVGLGGAMFPAHIKLCPPESKRIDTFILNGAECEPYLTADERIMVERTEDVVYGMKVLMKALGVEKGYIAIEENKPEAIEKLRAKSEERRAKSKENIEVVAVKTKYPQGAERMLIKRILNREVPLGGLPFDVGVLVNNVGTAVAVAEAIKTGLPLIKRVVTVSGEKIKNPENLEVKIGALFKDLVNFCGIDGGDLEIKMGGPMMGIVEENLDLPVIKGTTGILVTFPSEIKFDLLKPCIKCGRCLDVCPMELNPSNLGLYTESENWKRMHSEGVLNCIECGCCNYICPSKRSLVEAFKLAKRKC